MACETRGWIWGALTLGLVGCVDGSPTFMGTEGASSGGSSTSGPIVEDVTGPPPPTTTSTSTTTTTTTSTDDTTGPVGSSTGEPGCVGDCPEHPLDVVFVVDNSGSMGRHQRRLAVAAEALLAQLEAIEAASGQTLDMHLMVTTTDFGNPLCTPFEPAGYDRARGAPISTACIDRLQDFTSLTGAAEPEACLDVCPVSVAPDGDFISVVGGEDNVPGGTVLEALQCLLPQGINGCGYESSLENMLQALNPAAPWNGGADPFLREGADLAIVLLTDEMDCSILDYSVMQDEAYMNVSPNTGMPSPSSAICWNAGVTCDGPDAMGLYTNCTPSNNGLLQPTDRYIGYLLDELANNQGKEVMMLTVVGIPQVVQHSVRPPYEPTLGGIDDLIYIDWIDLPYPSGHILPDDWAMGVTGAEKQWQLGIGPGCFGEDMATGLFQAQPPRRIQEVCESLDGQGSVHCCMESVCDDDLASTMTCLAGMIGTAL